MRIFPERQKLTHFVKHTHYVRRQYFTQKRRKYKLCLKDENIINYGELCGIYHFLCIFMIKTVFSDEIFLILFSYEKSKYMREVSKKSRSNMMFQRNSLNMPRNASPT